MLRDGPCLSTARQTDEERAERQKTIRRVLWWILWANLGVAVLKFTYGTWSGLVSVRADGLHSFTDGSSNLIGLLALRLAGAPPDREHPYGHRKIEVAASLAIGVMILFGMVQIVTSVVGAAQSGKRPHFGLEGFAVAGGTLAVNLVVAWVEARIGKKLNSLILLADARHTLSDSLATVVVLIGMVLIQMGFYQADLLAAAVVVVLIVGAAWEIFKVGAATLLDNIQLDPGRIRELAMGVPGVSACHAVRSRGQPDFVFVDLHVLVDPNLSVREGHNLSHEVSRVLLEAIPEIADVMVHIEPWDDRDMPDYEEEGAAKGGAAKGGATKEGAAKGGATNEGTPTGGEVKKSARG